MHGKQSENKRRQQNQLEKTHKNVELKKKMDKRIKKCIEENQKKRM
jgi:hypothetical protein